MRSGVHLVALDRELGRGGDEHEDGLLIELSNALRRRHSVDGPHLNVQEQHVETGTVPLEDLGAVFKDRDLEGLPVLLLVTAQIVEDEFATDRIIFDDADPNHLPAPSAARTPRAILREQGRAAVSG